MNFWFRRRQEDLDAAAHRLATESECIWSAEKAVYDLDDGQPIPVQWEWDTDRSRPREEILPALETGTGTGTSTGVVSDLYARVYSRLPKGTHMVVLGEAGTGKSAAMLLLLLDALEDRRENPDVRVPVWITLSSWNPHERRLCDLAVEAMQWLLPRLRKKAVYGPAAAMRLFSEGKVALFLDGLDEMPKEQREAAMTAVATEAGDLPVVITSSEYVRPMVTGRAIAAPVVLRLRPLGVGAVAQHLTHGQAGADRRVWQELADHIVTHPEGPVATALNTPLYASLTRAAYPEPDPVHDPGELVAVGDADTIRDMVIGRFLDRVYPRDPETLHHLEEHRRRTHRGSRFSRRRADRPRKIPARRLSRQRRQTLRFLEWTAFHLGDSTDLRWWQMPNWAPLDRLPGACALPVALCAMTLCLVGSLVTGGTPVMLLIGTLIAAGGLSGLFGVLAFSRLHQAGNQPLGVRIRRPTADEASDMLHHGLTPAAPVFMGLYLVQGFLAGLGGSLGIFLVWVLGGDLTDNGSGGLLSVWSRSLTDGKRITVPRSYRDDGKRTAYVVLTVTVVTGMAIAFAGSIDGDPAVGLRYGCAIGATMGWLLGLGPAVVLWLAPMVTERSLGMGYRSFTRHLRTAHQLKVIRQTGVVYQFRHAALQKHLRRRYHTETSSARRGEPTGLNDDGRSVI